MTTAVLFVIAAIRHDYPTLLLGSLLSMSFRMLSGYPPKSHLVSRKSTCWAHPSENTAHPVLLTLDSWREGHSLSPYKSGTKATTRPPFLSQEDQPPCCRRVFGDHPSWLGVMQRKHPFVHGDAFPKHPLLHLHVIALCC